MRTLIFHNDMCITGTKEGEEDPASQRKPPAPSLPPPNCKLRDTDLNQNEETQGPK